MLTDFQNIFTAGFKIKFATKRSLQIPPHLKNTTALPRETVMFQFWQFLERTYCKNVRLMV
jgi:hypothetical protein